MAWPPPASSSPLSFAASTAAPRSTPEIDRPEPLPVPSSISAMTIAGRPKRSLSRPATMPITPGCQPLPMTVSTAAPLSFAACSSACSQTSISIARRSSLSRSSSAAIVARFLRIGGGQQAHAEVGLADAAAGVDPRPEREAEIAAATAP